jgi:hypothetical protein
MWHGLWQPYVCRRYTLAEVQVQVNLHIANYVGASKAMCVARSVGRSVLVSGKHLGPATNVSFSLKFPLDSCGFVILYLPL